MEKNNPLISLEPMAAADGAALDALLNRRREEHRAYYRKEHSALIERLSTTEGIAYRHAVDDALKVIAVERDRIFHFARLSKNYAELLVHGGYFFRKIESFAYDLAELTHVLLIETRDPEGVVS